MKCALASLVVLATVSLAAIQSNAPAGKLEITTLSTDAALVTGGDVLVKVAAPRRCLAAVDQSDGRLARCERRVPADERSGDGWSSPG
jgi:hypothetical protein